MKYTSLHHACWCEWNIQKHKKIKSKYDQRDGMDGSPLTSNDAATLRRQNVCQVNDEYAWKAILISSVMAGHWKNRLFQLFRKMPHALCIRTLWMKCYPTNSWEHPWGTGTCARNNAMPCPQWFLTVKTDPETKALRTTLQSQSRRPCIPSLPEDEGVGMTSFLLMSWERSSRRAFLSWKWEKALCYFLWCPCLGVFGWRPDA